MYRLKIIEAYGTGIPRIFGAYTNLPVKPTISTGGSSFTITLPAERDEDTTPLMRFLKDRTEFTRAELEENLNLNKSEAIAKINMLLEDGSIIKIGNGRSVRYRLKISLWIHYWHIRRCWHVIERSDRIRIAVHPLEIIQNLRVVGPSRFELELLTPQARRIPSYPTGPHINSLLDTPNAQWYLYFTQSDFIELQHLDDENPCIESINTTIQTEITSIVHSCVLLSSYLTENMSKIRTTERERWSRWEYRWSVWGRS